GPAWPGRMRICTVQIVPCGWVRRSPAGRQFVSSQKACESPIARGVERVLGCRKSTQMIRHRSRELRDVLECLDVRVVRGNKQVTAAERQGARRHRTRVD